MLIIRDAQLRVLAREQLRQFEQSLTEHLLNRFPDVEFTQDLHLLRAFVSEGIERATSFGVVDRYDVRRFLEFRSEYGAEFDALPWASKILSDKTLSGCGKMEQLDSYTTFTLRAAAR
jgi:hypothetical protein